MRDIIASQEMRSPSLLPFDLHITADSTVQRHGVPFRSLVVGFYHIDLAIIGPVVPICQPKRWPCSTAIRRVENVEDEEPVVVVSLGFDPHRLTAASCIGIGSVHLENDGFICSVSQVQMLCRFLIDVSSIPSASLATVKRKTTTKRNNVLHKAKRRILGREIVKLVKKRRPRVIFHQLVIQPLVIGVSIPLLRPLDRTHDQYDDHNRDASHNQLGPKSPATRIVPWPNATCTVPAAISGV